MKILVIFAIISLAGYSNACSCINRPPVEKFCKADFAILVKVLDSGYITGNQRRYKIDLKATFRSNTYGWINTQYIYTATDSAACGIILQQGYYYIITGYYRSTSMHTGLCDMRTQFRTDPLPRYMPPQCTGSYVPGGTNPAADLADVLPFEV